MEVGRAADQQARLRMGWVGLGGIVQDVPGRSLKEADIFDRIHDDFRRVLSPHAGRRPSERRVPYLDTALGAGGRTGRQAGRARVLSPVRDTRPGRGTLSGATTWCTRSARAMATGFSSQCIWDDALKVDRDGMVTLVVYPPVLEERVRRSGLNRLLRGYTATTSLTYRQLLPSPDFDGAALKVPALPLPLPPDVNLDQYKASTYVAQYAPTGTYYTGPEFDAWLRHRRARKEEAEK